MRDKKMVLEVRFNDKLQSIFLDGYRIGGCKWNDIDNGKEIKIYINKQDLFHELKDDLEIIRKETAKEIFTDLGDIYIHPALDRLKDFEWFKLFAKKYGVELDNE